MNKRTLLFWILSLFPLSGALATCYNVYMVYSDAYGNVIYADFLYSYCISNSLSNEKPTLYDQPVGGGTTEYLYMTSTPPLAGECSKDYLLNTIHMGSCTAPIYGNLSSDGNCEWKAFTFDEANVFCSSVQYGEPQKLEEQSVASWPKYSWDAEVRATFNAVWALYLFPNAPFKIRTTDKIRINTTRYFSAPYNCHLYNGC